MVLTLSTTTNSSDAALLSSIARIIPILADVSRADVVICEWRDQQAQVVAHSQPHSIAPVHRDSLVGQALTREDSAALFRAIEVKQYARGQRESAPFADASEGPLAPVMQEAYPIENDAGQIIGGMLIETNLLESERLKRRSEVFQRVLKMFQQGALRGEPADIDRLSPFGEHDGIIVADADGMIRYMSGIATNLYRNIGFGESLVGKPLSYLETQDDELVRQGIATRRCLRVELEERGRTWVKQVIPVARLERGSILAPMRTTSLLACLLIHDNTEARQHAQERLVQTTMIRELHHRVKNDLQTVAAL